MCRQLAQEALNEGRGRDPGDTGREKRIISRGSALNEGRSRDPGDTRIEAPLILEEPRSTKAGAETPATQVPLKP